MVEHDTADPIVITSDQDFRHPMMLGYYARPPLTDRAIRYVGHYVLPVEGAGWYILHLRASWRPPPPNLVDRWGHRYDLAEAYRSDILSGYHLVLYRRAADSPRVSVQRPIPNLIIMSGETDDP